METILEKKLQEISDMEQALALARQSVIDELKSKVQKLENAVAFKDGIIDELKSQLQELKDKLSKFSFLWFYFIFVLCDSDKILAGGSETKEKINFL